MSLLPPPSTPLSPFTPSLLLFPLLPPLSSPLLSPSFLLYPLSFPPPLPLLPLPLVLTMIDRATFVQYLPDANILRPFSPLPSERDPRRTR